MNAGRRIFRAVLAGLLVCFVYFGDQRNQYNLVSHDELIEIRKQLSQIDPEEVKDLAYFFDYAVVLCQYPYTLVGYKPMSICNYLQDAEDLLPSLQADYRRKKHRAFADRIERGFQIWQRHKHLFASRNFQLVASHSPISKGMKQITLLHKELCRQVVTSHSSLFLSQLPRSADSADILESLSDPSHPQFHELQENDLLLGVLLGFGVNNATLFKAKERTKLKVFSNEWLVWPRKWRLPGFLCDPSTQETQELRSRYSEARKYIRWTYFNRNDLEVTLALLVRPQKVVADNDRVKPRRRAV